MPDSTRVSTTESEDSPSTFADLSKKVEAVGASLFIVRGITVGILFLLVLELLGVAVDLWRDRSAYEQAASMNLATQERILVLESQLFEYRTEIIKKEKVVRCLRIKKYWEFPSCFEP